MLHLADDIRIQRMTGTCPPFIQMNEMSARALTMEELENVNGGIRVKSKGGETDPRQKRFEIRVK